MDDVMKKLRGDCERTIEAIQHELAHIRTGRATPQLLDGIRVEYYGTAVPLTQVATISVPEPRLITVQPWEKNLIGDISKAIQKSELGLNPASDGNLIRLPIPALTEERRRDLVKLVKKVGEEGKVSMRNHRREANEALKKLEKAKELTEDQLHRANDQVQKITDDHIKRIDEVVSRKDAEVMEV
jgi:ribosome recycling factor